MYIRGSNKITPDIAGILRDSGFPGLSRYYLLDLKDNKTCLLYTSRCV